MSAEEYEKRCKATLEEFVNLKDFKVRRNGIRKCLYNLYQKLRLLLRNMRFASIWNLIYLFFGSMMLLPKSYFNHLLRLRSSMGRLVWNESFIVCYQKLFTPRQTFKPGQNSLYFCNQSGGHVGLIRVKKKHFGLKSGDWWLLWIIAKLTIICLN